MYVWEITDLMVHVWGWGWLSMSLVPSEVPLPVHKTQGDTHSCPHPLSYSFQGRGLILICGIATWWQSSCGLWVSRGQGPISILVLQSLVQAGYITHSQSRGWTEQATLEAQV